MSGRLVTVFGGSGFIGRYVVERLARSGDRVRVAVRHPDEALFLKALGDVGQIQLVATNVRDRASVARALRGADAAVNLVGILFGRGKQTFSSVQAEAPGILAEEAASAGVRQFVHMSAIGADPASEAQYARTKALGEDATFAAFPRATVLRPSLVIGPEDGFFNRFAKLMKLAPLLPIPGLGAKFQPVYVGDVADAVLCALEGGERVEGKLFELGGPKVYSFREMLELLMDEIGIHRPLINLPRPVAMLQATFLGLLPNPPLTRDQVRLLAEDNIVALRAHTFRDLGLEPKAITGVLPRYLAQYRRRGQFDKS